MVHRQVLSNGIRFVYEEIPYLRSVSLGVWIDTGSRDEPEQWSGISHFLEHMFFKGTSHHSARQLAELFDQIGGQVNAYTTKEYTSLHARVLDEHAELAMSTLAEMLFDSVFSVDEIEREKKVIMEEIKMYEDNPEEAVHDWIVEHTYNGHPLGANILGTEAHLRNLKRQDILDYMIQRYTPERMVITMAGRFDPDKMQTLVEAKFGHLTSKGQDLVSGAPVFEPANIFDPRPIEQTHVCLAMKGFSHVDPRMYALALLNHLLGASSSSLLFQEVREERGLAYSVFSYHSSYRDTGLFTIYFGCSPEKAQEVLQLVRAILQNLKENGVTEEVLEKAKTQVISSFWLGHESPSSRMSRMAKNELYFQRQVEPDEAVTAIASVSTEDVKNIARLLFDQPLSFVALGPVQNAFSL